MPKTTQTFFARGADILLKGWTSSKYTVCESVRVSQFQTTQFASVQVLASRHIVLPTLNACFLNDSASEVT